MAKHMEIVYLKDQTAKLEQSDIDLIARACDVQQSRDFAPSCGRSPDFAVVASQPNVPHIVGILKDTRPDQPGTLADHFVNADGNGEIEIFIGEVLANKGTIIQGANSVSASVSHEINEYRGDPFTNEWIDTNGMLVDEHGKPWKEVCNENCDPVEDEGYAININGKEVWVSNFVLPAWRNPFLKVPTRRDFLGLLPHDKAFTKTKDGYLIVRDRPGHEIELFSETYPTWKLTKKRAFGSRSSRRRFSTVRL